MIFYGGMCLLVNGMASPYYGTPADTIQMYSLSLMPLAPGAVVHLAYQTGSI